MSCSSDDQPDKECPLCTEQLEIDDRNFYPCKCEYQICRFCWHRLRTDENGLCPACRQPYPEEPPNFEPLSTDVLAKIKSEKKMKQQAERQRMAESREILGSYRVLQTNLVYVVGLSAKLADPERLRKHEYFGKYGKIVKISVGTAPANILGNATHTAYVTYLRVEEALRAIQGVHNAMVDGKSIKASLGTTKYCANTLRGRACNKHECMYLHDMADPDISFTKEDMAAGKNVEYERRLMETLLKPTVSLPLTQSSGATQPLSTLSNTLPAAAAKKKYEFNGRAKDLKSLEEGRKYEEKKLEDSPVTASAPLSVRAPVSPTSSSPVQSSVSSTEKLNGKAKKNDEMSNGQQTKNRSVRREKKENTVIPSSSIAGVPGDSMTLPPELPVSPSVECASRYDGPSFAPPPGLPPPPHLVAANSSTTLTPASESRVSSPPCESPSVSSVSASQWETLLGLPPRPESPPVVVPHHSSPSSNGFLSDDDLGFDPFHEIRGELAALVEDERKAVLTPSPSPPPSFPPPPSTLPPPPHLQHVQHLQQQQMHHQYNGGVPSYNSFEMDSMGSGHFSSRGLSSLYPGGLNGLDSSRADEFSYSSNGFGGGSPSHSLSSQSLASRFSSLDMTNQSRTSYDVSSSLSSPALFHPPPGLGVPHRLHAHPPGLGPPRPLMGGHVPGLAAPSTVPQGLAMLAALRNPLPSSTPAPLLSMSDWQEEFKSLLPNINVTFSAESEREFR